ncbi:DNA/RNA non-specific endonuclease [Ensifer adhaerens]|uniref:DNA/RNA non-specific endonuclease n=1 Tax=Ensifer adhaerens TaxID=106592 RepID=UPI003CFDAD31
MGGGRPWPRSSARRRWRPARRRQRRLRHDQGRLRRCDVGADRALCRSIGQGPYQRHQPCRHARRPVARQYHLQRPRHGGGREGISADVGGHIQACRHGGSCDRFNLFPQNSNFNNGAYRQWENEITRALKNGDDVGEVTVIFGRSNPRNPRPDTLEVEYTINGRTQVRQFENQAGGGQ